jgi:hypothetical protein
MRGRGFPTAGKRRQMAEIAAEFVVCADFEGEIQRFQRDGL